MPAIPKGFGSIEDLIKRADVARVNWELWRSLHQEAFDFAAPQRETFRLWSPGQNKNRHVFDATAIDGLVSFANRIQGSMIPSWMQWMSLAAGDEIPKDEKDKVDQSLEESTGIFFANLNHSNFSTEITPALSDLGIGTGAIMVEAGEFNVEEALKFSNIPLAELHPELPASGPIKNAWRPQEIEGRHIKTLWPNAKLPQQLKNQVKKDPHQKVDILNGMLFNKTDGLYWQLVIHKATKALIFSQSFKSRRLIIFRWHVTPGEVFGGGPILQKLPDIRTVNKVKEFILRNAAIQIAGVYTGRDDGIFNPHTARIAPGVILPVAQNGTQNPSLQALPRAGDIGLAGIVLEDLQNSIKKALLSDPLGEVTDPVKSATEQLMRKQRDLEDRGASFGRLKSELIEPLVAAVVDILQALGKLPKMRVDGKEVTMRQESPLAKAEGLEDFRNEQVWMSHLQQTLPPEVILGTVRVEDIPKETAKLLGVSADRIRTDDERKQFGKVIQSAAQTQLEGGGLESEGTS